MWKSASCFCHTEILVVVHMAGQTSGIHLMGSQCTVWQSEDWQKIRIKKLAAKQNVF